MSNWQDGGIDPDFAEGVGKGVENVTGLPGWARKAFEWYVRKVNDVASGINPPDFEGGEDIDWGDPLAEEAAEGIRDFRSGGVPNPTGEGPMDVGRDEYGVDMPEGGTPRVAERMEVREPLPMEPVEEDQSMTAEMDYVLSGDNGYQRISRFVGLLEDLGVLGAGSAGSDAVPVARKAYEDATGERAPFSSYDSLAQAMEDPAVAEIILSGL